MNQKVFAVIYSLEVVPRAGILKRETQFAFILSPQNQEGYVIRLHSCLQMMSLLLGSGGHPR
jgi:hypothetical protein